MKHLKPFNESNTDRKLSPDIINACFAYAFDLVEKKEIYEVYADPKTTFNFKTRKEGDPYFFAANIGTEQEYIEGYQIEFNTSFHDASNLEDFRKYIELLNLIDEGIHKLKEIYKVDIIQFDGISNSLTCLIVAYNDIKNINDL